MAFGPNTFSTEVEHVSYVQGDLITLHDKSEEESIGLCFLMSTCKAVQFKDGSGGFTLKNVAPNFTPDFGLAIDTESKIKVPDGKIYPWGR